ncbi:MAG: LysR family transcriptional regulator [Marinosulfonomonas sp.]|nr:LysR family transcriptional regulator [Marinosulfonomonas sp.]
MHNDENWDDMRFVLAVAEAGTVTAAARTLGVNHATVLRRVAAFEERYNIRIFDKTAKGYAIVDGRLRVIDAAREVETAIRSVAEVIQGTQAPLRGVVRVTSTDTFCHVVLPEMVATMQKSAQGLRIELLSSNAHLDLSRLHADITVRPAVALDPDLTGEVAAQLGFDVYAHPDADGDRWLGLSGAIARSVVAEWMAGAVAASAITGAGDSFVTLRELAAAGLGQAVLPCVLGDADPRLERRRGIMPPMPVDLWVASHVDLADVGRIRAARALLIEALAAKADWLAGLD